MNRTPLTVYCSRRMAALVGLGFASGLPLMLTSRTLRVWARDQGVDLATVGLIGLVALPYAYKFLWAPILDRVPPPFLDRRRGWMLILQFLVMLAIAGLALTGPSAGESELTLFLAMATALAFLAASQDIVTDAYRTDVLTDSELGAGASVFTTGFRVAMLATGAGAVWLASELPWRSVYLIAGAAMGACMLVTLLAPSPSASVHPPRTMTEAIIEPARDFLRRYGSGVFVILAFILVFKLPDYLATAMTDAMLLDLGYTKQEISLWSLGAGTAVTIPGAVAGGFVVTRLGLRRSLYVLGAAQAVSNAGYLALSGIGEPNRSAMIVVVAIEYFCVGLVAAGFIAFLMSQCNRSFSATQYALLSSLMGLSNSLAGAPAGYLVQAAGKFWFFIINEPVPPDPSRVEMAGYPGFLILSIIVAVPGLVMLHWLPLPKEDASTGVAARGADSVAAAD